VRTEYAGVKVVSVPAKIGAHVGLIKEGWMGIVRASRAAGARRVLHQRLP
jgi:hypothetical protein